MLSVKPLSAWVDVKQKEIRNGLAPPLTHAFACVAAGRVSAARSHIVVESLQTRIDQLVSAGAMSAVTCSAAP